MSTKRILLQDKNGNDVMPITYAKNVYVSQQQTLADIIGTGEHEIDVLDVPIDSAISATSENPVQNKVIKSALDSLDDTKVDKVNDYGLGTIATRVQTYPGKEWKEVYFKTDLPDNRVTIPAYTSDLENDSEFADKSYVDSLAQTKVDKVEGKGLSTNDLTDKHMLTLNKFDGYDTHVEFNGDSLVMTGHTLYMPDIQSAVQVQAEGEIISNISGKLHKLSEKVDISDVKNARPYVENTIPTSGELSLNTIYDIGIQSNNEITLVLPRGNVGNFIQVDFITENIMPSLIISAASSALLSDYDFTPEPNMIYSLFFDYGVLGYDETAESNIYGWRFNYAEYTYTPDGSEG